MMTDPHVAAERDEALKQIRKKFGIGGIGWSQYRESYEAAFEAGRSVERERITKYAAAESRYWNDSDAGDISIGGIAAASNILAEVMMPGKAIGRIYDENACTIIDDPDPLAKIQMPAPPKEKP